ncbi:MAG: hypothetical protein MUC96_27300 [Myxococcaceae bacterium]|nr:hypothetical protein [Myxococcaceae bacterium]
MPMSARHFIAMFLVAAACGQPEPEAPLPQNQPLRIIAGSQSPLRSQSVLRLGANCPPMEAFSFRVTDPDLQDTIRASWFIDPNERYVPGPLQPVFSGNPGTTVAGSTDRVVRSPSSLRVGLLPFADGLRHRVEVVVTDGDFVETTSADPVTGEPLSFLDVTRSPVRTASGQTVPIEAFRDDTVWFVEVSTTPCL